jgi:hypothetical protein
MDQDRTLNDAALTREIEQALAVDPSPEFLARVRTRIAREPELVAWSAWRLVGTGALAVGFGVALLGTWLNRDAVSPAPSASVAAPPMATPAHVTQTRPRASAEPARQSLGQRPRTHPTLAVFTDREVVIPPGEAIALHALAVSLREGRVDAPAWERGTDAQPLAPLDEILIQPINIEPLPQLALQEGTHPW